MLAAARGLNKIFTTSYSSIIIAVGCRCLSDYEAHESSKYMQKLINKRGAQTKKKWYQPHIAEPMEVFSVQPRANKHGVTPAQRARARQLSHVLYDKITQIINTGELSEEILNKQVFITSVKMQTGFGGVNVYWDSSRSDAAEIDGFLQSCARKLRSILISYHVLGRIPPITFVRDNAMGDQIRLKQLFEVADYGPDYVPSSQRIKTQQIEEQQFLTRWGSSQDSNSAQPLKAHTCNSPNIVFPILDSFKVDNNTDDATCPATVDENVTTCNDPAFVQSSAVENQDIDFMQGLQFRSNLYGLPHEDLMKKVSSHKSKVKCPSTETPDTAAELKFDLKHFKSRKDKLKMMSIKDSRKLKEQLLQIDVEDLMNTPSQNDDYTDEMLNEEYNSNHNQTK